MEPIKVSLFNVNVTDKIINVAALIVFVGNVPDNIKKSLAEIKKIVEKSPDNYKIVKKNYKNLAARYGDNWDVKLGIARKIAGGDDIDDLLEELDVADTKKYAVLTKGTMQIIWVYDYNILPYDRVSEFKLKIYAAINIPPYRQHLWANGAPLEYDILESGVVVRAPISDLLDTIKKKKYQHIGDIPVDTRWYSEFDNLKIIGRDEFTIMENIKSAHFYLVDLDNLLNAADKWNILREQLLADSYRSALLYSSIIFIYFPMMTKEVFSVYIKNKDDVGKVYPELMPNINNVRARFRKENDLQQFAVTTTGAAPNLHIAIVSSLLGTYAATSRSSINIRNVFDFFPLSEWVDYCEALIYHNNTKICVQKVFKREISDKKDLFKIFHAAHHKLSVESILFRVRLDLRTTESMYVKIFYNGNYTISGMWKPEARYNYDDIYNITKSRIQPIIDEINGLGDKIFYYPNTKIQEVSRQNTKVIKFSIDICWNMAITEDQFNIFQQIGAEFEAANIFIRGNSLESSIFSYYFYKGMYLHNIAAIDRLIETNNTYEYLSNGYIQNKWNMLYNTTHKVEIIHQIHNIKFNIMNIKDAEYKIILKYVHILINMFLQQYNQIKHKKREIIYRLKRKTLSDNKQQDPKLYNLQQLGEKFIYSRICQKPYQPVMLSDSEYANLDAEQKSRAIKYWNFTTNEPQWYLSINPVYKYIKFITGKHPKGYCIPCGKKNKISDNPANPKRIIYEACLKDHLYLSKQVKTSTQYIMSYSKNIELGRLAYLPKKTLKSIFYTAASAKHCQYIANAGENYYIYGVEQDYRDIKHIGYVYCISYVLDYSILDFIDACIQKISADYSKIYGLLGGNINLYFPLGSKDIIAALTKFKNGKTHIISPIWNVLFRDIAHLYFAVNTIIFEDGAEVNDNSDINLVLDNQIDLPHNFIQETHKNLIIVWHKKYKKYYPIIKLNPQVFFRTRIAQKLFTNDNKIILMLNQIVYSKFSPNDSIIKLPIIKEFLAQNKDWQISKVYSDYNNRCYGIKLRMATGEYLYIPVHLSACAIEKHISYKIADPCKINTFDLLHKYMVLFNKWLKKSVYKAILPIVIDKWVILNSMAAGFIHGGLTYYFRPFAQNSAIKIANVPRTLINNSPHSVNRAICDKILNKEKKIVNKFQNINVILYHHYLYRLFYLEFVYYYSFSKNKKKRKEIAAIIVGADFDDMSGLTYKLEHILSPEDLQKISSLLSSGRDIKKIIDEVDRMHFDFDNVIINKFKGKNRAEIQKELCAVSKKIIKIGNPPTKIAEFNNYLTTCQTYQHNYCAGNKLMVPRDRIDTFIDILADEIMNPLKQHWMFSSVLADRNIMYYKFIKRPHEYIRLSEK